MSVVGMIRQFADAETVSVPGQSIGFLVTAAQSKGCSIFMLSVAPGFEVGAHYHNRMEEFFYVVEGEATLTSGDRTVRGGPGTFLFVPPGVAHSYGNPGPDPARLLLITTPPGFENYFAEMAQLPTLSGRPDPEAMAALRLRYDTVQIAAPTVKLSE